jgi:hypothetical protein
MALIDPPAIDSFKLAEFAGTGIGLMQGKLHPVYGGRRVATPYLFILPTLIAEPRSALTWIGTRGGHR